MNYEQRRDFRSHEEFAQHISDSTKKELYLVHRWQLEMQLKGKYCCVIPYGLDPSGNVNLNRQNGQPDFQLVNSEKLNQNLEVKNSPVMNKVTFKLLSMRNIVKWDAWTLLFINTGQQTKHSIKEMDLSQAYWALFDCSTMNNILQDYHDKIFRWKPFGNKECVQILEKDFTKYFSLNRFEFEL